MRDHRAGQQPILVSDRLSLPCLLPESYCPSLQGLARAWSPRAADLPRLPSLATSVPLSFFVCTQQLPYWLLDVGSHTPNCSHTPSPKVPTHHQTMGASTQVEFPPSGSRRWKGPGSGGSVSPAGTGDCRTASKDSQASQSTLTIYFPAVSLHPVLTPCPSSLEPGHLSWLLLHSCLIAAKLSSLN